MKFEPLDSREYEGLLRSAVDRLKDAHNPASPFSSRLDLACNATHALALTALRLRGYRSDRRYLVFQSLPPALEPGKTQVRLFTLCHKRRNLAEYEGYMEVDERLLAELLTGVDALLPTVKTTLSELAAT
ncbi:hypothetical protein [Pseudomonas sp. TCU-HL1]|uniref:hypothetical protein n=1 Tax=Pseudomonas sp. TCU-HL1 TaxID=1856685 RepID=UPI00083D891A|nr:hypothetical protein [Pseudomonas sp. TCU-HL1]